MSQKNIDQHTVSSFGDQWAYFDHDESQRDDIQFLFDRYFQLVDWGALPQDAKGFDAGSGTGRWALLAAEKLGHLHCIDASDQAMNVAKRNLQNHQNCSFHVCSIEDAPIEKASLDFGYSLGVLHHMPDTQAALDACATYLKPNAPFLVYLYYNFDNQKPIYRAMWKASEYLRKFVTSLPRGLRNGVCNIIAGIVYWPLAMIAKLGEKIGFNVDNWPLSDYRHTTFYRMRHNARDRLGTELEQRFSKAEITTMMEKSGFQNIKFMDGKPYWCAIGYKI